MATAAMRSVPESSTLNTKVILMKYSTIWRNAGLFAALVALAGSSFADSSSPPQYTPVTDARLNAAATDDGWLLL